MNKTFNQIDITQRILDRRHPKLTAGNLLANIDPGILGGAMPDIHLLSKVLYDGFSQTRMDLEGDTQRNYINAPETLFAHVIRRYIERSTGGRFVEASTPIFDKCEKADKELGWLKFELNKVDKNLSLKLACTAIRSEIEPHKEFLNKTWLMSVSRQTIANMNCNILRKHYNPDYKESTGRGFKLLPSLHKIRIEIDDATARLNEMTDVELCHRAIRAIERMDLGTRDPEQPVYGIKTMYSYMPTIIERLFVPSKLDNDAIHAELNERFDAARSVIERCRRQLDRLVLKTENEPCL